MFYDLLLLDNTVCIRESYNKQRQQLQSLVYYTFGRVDIGSCEVIDSSSPSTTELLYQAFAEAIARRWEGFVLKGCIDPYFSFSSAEPFIKLKRDYIPGLGDTADFAIVRGRRSTKDKEEIGIGKLW
jgi:DNA ligase 4